MKMRHTVRCLRRGKLAKGGFHFGCFHEGDFYFWFLVIGAVFYLLFSFSFFGRFDLLILYLELPSNIYSDVMRESLVGQFYYTNKLIVINWILYEHSMSIYNTLWHFKRIDCIALKVAGRGCM